MKSCPDPLKELEPADLYLLLTLRHDEVLGAIIRLNLGPRYHNRLNAIEVLARIEEMQREEGVQTPAA